MTILFCVEIYNTIKELKQINQKINIISKKCEDIANAVEQIEDHSTKLPIQY